MSLLSRIGWLERQFGTDKSPRRIMIWYGPHYLENWIEWRVNDATLYVRTPNHQSDPMDYLTSDQRRTIRPNDSVVSIASVSNGRDSHLQRDRPPWKRSDAELDGWAEQRVKSMADGRERDDLDDWAEEQVKAMAERLARENNSDVTVLRTNCNESNSVKPCQPTEAGSNRSYESGL